MIFDVIFALRPLFCDIFELMFTTTKQRGLKSMKFSSARAGAMQSSSVFKNECTKVGLSKKTNLPSFLLYREILASFQSFQGLYVKIRPDFGNI